MEALIDLLEKLRDYFEELAKQRNLPLWVSSIPLMLTLAIAIGSLARMAWAIGHFFWRIFRNRAFDRDLHPFGDHKVVKELNKNYVGTRLLRRTPSDFGELLEVMKSIDRKSTTSFKQFYEKLLTESDNKFYFILGESGLGKTTFLMNLFAKYHNRFRRKYKIKYIPLGHPHSISELEKLLDSAASTILFIDGLDELTSNNVQGKTFKEISEVFYKFRIVVISCRTQFFESQASEPLRTPFPKITAGFYEYDKYYVSPFSEAEVFRYLRKRYRFRFRKRRRASRIVLSAINLMVRPFLLKNIGYLIGRKATSEDYGYSLGIYKTLIDSWIDRDVSKIHSEEVRRLHKLNLLPMLQNLAMISFTKGIRENNYYLDKEEIKELAGRYNVNVEFVQVRSLLNRDNFGNIKFAHKSVLEYFVALEATVNDDILSIVLSNPAFDVANVFIDEYDFFKRIKPLIAGFDGFYIEHNSHEQKPLSSITWSSMYSAKAIYLTKFDAADNLSDIFRFKKLQELVLMVSVEDLRLADLYHIFYSCWFEFLDTIGSVFDYLYINEVKIEEVWLKLYKTLYRLHYKDIQGDIFYQKASNLVELNAIDDMWMNQAFDSSLKSNANIELTGTENDFELLVKTLYNEKLVWLIERLTTLTPDKVRTMVGPRVSITTYSLQTPAAIIELDRKVSGFSQAPVEKLREMNKMVAHISRDLSGAGKRVKIYY